MRERLEALKAQYEGYGASHFPWDELIHEFEGLEMSAVAVAGYLEALETRVKALESAAFTPSGSATQV